LLVAFRTLTTCIVVKSFVKGLVNILPAVDAVSTAALAANEPEGIGIKTMELHEIQVNQRSYCLEQFSVYRLLIYLHKVTKSDKPAHFKRQPSALLDKRYCCGNLAALMAADHEPIWLIVGQVRHCRITSITRRH